MASFDIDGVDAAHKATILSAIAFGIPVQFDKAHVEGINQTFASTLFYGNSSVSQEEFTGFSIRYSDSTAGNGRNGLPERKIFSESPLKT